jgi:hypothetical protein
MNDLQISKTDTTIAREATISVFAPVLAPLFPTLSPPHSARSPGVRLTFRDGTDPLLRGHQAAPTGRHRFTGESGGMA